MTEQEYISKQQPYMKRFIRALDGRGRVTKRIQKIAYMHISGIIGTMRWNMTEQDRENSEEYQILSAIIHRFEDREVIKEIRRYTEDEKNMILAKAVFEKIFINGAYGR